MRDCEEESHRGDGRLVIMRTCRQIFPGRMSNEIMVFGCTQPVSTNMKTKEKSSRTTGTYRSHPATLEPAVLLVPYMSFLYVFQPLVPVRSHYL